MPANVLRISPLRLRVFAGCRLRYRYQYIERRRARLRLQDTAGTLVHNVLSEFFAKTPAGERSAEQLLRLFDERWAALSPRYLRIPGVEALRVQSRAQLDRFASEADIQAAPYLIEAQFQVELAPGVILMGRVDRVDESNDGSLTVIDYKSGEPPEEVDPRQLYLYAAIVEAQTGRTVARGVFWDLEEGRRTEIALDSAAKKGALEDARRLAAEMAAVDDFPASVAPHCAHCPYLQVCDYRDEIARRRHAEGW